jgi:hypothetical protein
MDLLCELFKTAHNDEIYFEVKGSALKRKGKKRKEKEKPQIRRSRLKTNKRQATLFRC